MTSDPKLCLTGGPRGGCPMAANRRERIQPSEAAAQTRQWLSSESPRVGERWINARCSRKDAEMLVWFDRRLRVPIILHRVKSPMGETCCMNCPSRRWQARRGEGVEPKK
ncbi:MAG: hypothetical protein LBH66_00350 [Oscillospiraceae bacterium]|jgi:hypothetical protein|nr:hypothetical protein [Oscillospiraceae bacterium]